MEDTGFKRKKVEAMTLGERIRKLRSEYRMSFFEVSRATKIPVKYLEYLERAEYGKLPADVYVRGYLRNYAKHLGLPEDTLIKLYEKEQHIDKNLGRERVVSGISPRLPLPMTHFVITSKEVLMGIVALVLFVIGAYLYQEFRSFVSDPYLVIDQPVNGAVVTDTKILLSGRTDARAVVSVNDAIVPVSIDGKFEEELVLHVGQNTIIISAKNRFNKEKTVALSVEAKVDSDAMPMSDVSGSAPDRAEKKFSVEFSTKGTGVRVVVEVDGALVYSGNIDENSQKTFEAVQSVKIRSENGASTFVRIGGNPPEPISSFSGTAEKEFFSPNV